MAAEGPPAAQAPGPPRRQFSGSYLGRWILVWGSMGLASLAAVPLMLLLSHWGAHWRTKLVFLAALLALLLALFLFAWLHPKWRRWVGPRPGDPL